MLQFTACSWDSQPAEKQAVQKRSIPLWGWAPWLPDRQNALPKVTEQKGRTSARPSQPQTSSAHCLSATGTRPCRQCAWHLVGQLIQVTDSGDYLGVHTTGSQPPQEAHVYTMYKYIIQLKYAWRSQSFLVHLVFSSALLSSQSNRSQFWNKTTDFFPSLSQVDLGNCTSLNIFPISYSSCFKFFPGTVLRMSPWKVFYTFCFTHQILTEHHQWPGAVLNAKDSAEDEASRSLTSGCSFSLQGNVVIKQISTMQNLVTLLCVTLLVGD